VKNAECRIDERRGKVRFGIGDKVLVKLGEGLRKGFQDRIMPYGVKLTDEMLEYAGKIVTIKEKYVDGFSDYFEIEEDRGKNVWWDEAFLPVTPEDAIRWENDAGHVVSPLKRNDDPVAHPAHYTYGKIEVIDFIQDKDLNFALGNAVKYIVRAGHKAEQGMSDDEKAIQDLEKARQYIDFEIKHRKEARDRGSK
jgi:hypothetical protein